MEQINWFMQREGGTGMLLLVAVEGSPCGTGAWPCHVVGVVSPIPQAAPDFPAPPAPAAMQEHSLLTAETPADGAADIPAIVTHLLTEVGVPSHLLGYSYLQTGLTLVHRDVTLRRAITRTLYPRIAQFHGVSPRSVERAIRHAIAAAWERGGESRYRRALGRLASCVGERPTNAEFIAQLSEKLRLSA